MSAWEHIDPAQQAWDSQAHGVARKELIRVPTGLAEISLEPEMVSSFKGLGLVIDGELSLRGARMQSGALFTAPADQAVSAGAAGARWYQLQLPAHLQVQPHIVAYDAVPWEQFEDPAGRETQPVQVLLDGDVSVLRTRFVPTYSAGEHWHDFDTYYFITHGDMRFGQEGQYHAGHVRRVSGGYSYGPEEPGPQGVEFVLVSLGGPVALHWADLEPAPQGALD